MANIFTKHNSKSVQASDFDDNIILQNYFFGLEERILVSRATNTLPDVCSSISRRNSRSKTWARSSGGGLLPFSVEASFQGSEMYVGSGALKNAGCTRLMQIKTCVLFNLG